MNTEAERGSIRTTNIMHKNSRAHLYREGTRRTASKQQHYKALQYLGFFGEEVNRAETLYGFGFD
jgi:hypothetical protein